MTSVFSTIIPLIFDSVFLNSMVNSFTNMGAGFFCNAKFKKKFFLLKNIELNCLFEIAELVLG